MVALISAIVGRSVPASASVAPEVLDQWQRLEEAARSSMVAFEGEDGLGEQPADRAGPWNGEDACLSEAPGVTRRLASIIDECTAAVSSYLRPAF